jgi:hypothetical protein
MSETGNRLRALFEEIAPAIDMGRVMAAAGDHPRARRGWLIAVAAAIVALLAGGGWLLFLRGSSEPSDTVTLPVVTSTAGTSVTTEVDATSTSLADLLLAELRPVSVDCTSELAHFPCEALIDDDPNNDWNAREGGVGVEVTFYFSPPVQITEIVFRNVEDPERFARNARIRGLEVSLDDVSQATIAELPDSQAPQRVQVRSLRTSRLTVTITSAYPGEAYEGREPFFELALQEIEFFGRVAPEVDGGTTNPGATVTTSVAAEPIAGEWLESSLACCGAWGYVRDLLWDGAQFLALVRDPGDASLWRSEDGLAWEQVSALGDFTTTSGPGSIDHGDRGYLAGGSVGDEATVWYSADGGRWTQVTLGPGGVSDVAVTSSGFVAVGTSERLGEEPYQPEELTGTGMVWTSADGLQWQAAAFGPLPVYSRFGAVHVLGDRVVAIGFASDLGRRWDSRPIAAVSDAGGPWRTIEPQGLGAQQFDATAGAGGSLGAIESPEQLLWTSPSGEAWEAEPLGGLHTRSMGIFLPSALAEMDGRLVVAGGEDYVPDGEIYNRDDPVVWLREPDGTWRWAEGAPALDPPGGIIYMAAASPDRVVLVLDYQDGRLHLWVFRPED